MLSRNAGRVTRDTQLSRPSQDNILRVGVTSVDCTEGEVVASVAGLSSRFAHLRCPYRLCVGSLYRRLSSFNYVVRRTKHNYS
jgi:hypothetical protein